MFVPSVLVAQSSDSAAPQACKPFSLQSNVCVGDLIAILACSVAGIGFFFWAIHAIRKMREFPFNYNPEDQEKPDESEHVPSALDIFPPVQDGVSQPPSLPERVRARLALSEPEEGFYRSSVPTSYDTYYAQDSMTAPGAPRPPPPAGRQVGRTSLHHSGRHGLPTRGGAAL